MRTFPCISELPPPTKTIMQWAIQRRLFNRNYTAESEKQREHSKFVFTPLKKKKKTGNKKIVLIFFLFFFFLMCTQKKRRNKKKKQKKLSTNSTSSKHKTATRIAKHQKKHPWFSWKDKFEMERRHLCHQVFFAGNIQKYTFT